MPMIENQTTLSQSPGRSARSKAPVFVLGSHRSGTKLLYYSLLSAGGFAVFPEESGVYTVLGRHFGDLAVRGNRRKLLDTYCNTAMFMVTGLDPAEFEQRVMEECRNPGDLLRIQMEGIARKQGVERWAESTPKHLLSLPLIKKQIPNALVVHIIRDGRDSTASLFRSDRYRPLPWDKSRHYLACAMFWREMVGKGREYGQAMGPDYMEVHYEDLVRDPRATLAQVGKFIEHDLDYDRIQRVALGSVHRPNSSFHSDTKEAGASTTGRWKRVFTPEQARNLEWCLADLLEATGYKLETPASELRAPASVRFMNFYYPLYLQTRYWLKWNTPLARLEDRKSMAVQSMSSAASAAEAQKANAR
jgi:hypothetical protein